jgi:hypothetical protein
VHLYQGTSEQFIADAVQARLANQLADRFFQEFRYKASPSEVMSRRNSLGAIRGCYVYFMDAPTRDFVLSRTEGSSARTARAAETSSSYDS